MTETREEMSTLNCLSPSTGSLPAPILSVSPRLQNGFRKSFIAATESAKISGVSVHCDVHNLEGQNLSLHNNDCYPDIDRSGFCLDSPRFNSEHGQIARKSMTNIRSSVKREKNLSSPTDRLAESINHGLQIIANHRRANDSSNFSAEFSFGKYGSDGEVITDRISLPSIGLKCSSDSIHPDLSIASDETQVVTGFDSQPHLVQISLTADHNTSSASPVRLSSDSPCLSSVQNMTTIPTEPELHTDDQTMEPSFSSERIATLFSEPFGSTSSLAKDATLTFQTAPVVSDERSVSVAPPTNEQPFQESSSILSSEGLNELESQDQNLQAIAAAALRRERVMEEDLNGKIAEIEQLNRLVDQYKRERECNALLHQSREEKIARLERLMDGTIPTDVFLSEEWSSIINEHKIIQEKYDNHSEVTLAKINQQRLSSEIEQYRKFYKQGERETLTSEISQLRNQLQSYIDSDNSMPVKWRTSNRKLNFQDETSSDVTEAAACEACKEGKRRWREHEEEWMSLVDELRSEIQEYKQQAEKRKHELEGQQRCADEMKETLQIAMEGHARLLDQYAELQEKHIALLAKHRKTRDAMSEARRKAGKMGFLGTKWFEAQAAELSALKFEQEEERRAAMEQIESLQAQVRDTADAVQAAGELLVRLKEAEETALIAQDAAALAAEDVEKLWREMDKMKRRHATEMATLQQRLLEARFQKSKVCPMCLMAERVKFEFSGVEETDAEEAQLFNAAGEESQFEEEDGFL